ncbi:MAG: hypothetical protein EB148_00475 [Actinobacteria bacterium]|nr:hypothetical protein [Actinomycetota bacterium]
MTWRSVVVTVVPLVDVVGASVVEPGWEIVFETRTVVLVAGVLAVVAPGVDVVARNVEEVVVVVVVVEVVALLRVMRSGQPSGGVGIRLKGPRYSARASCGTVRKR